MTSRTKSLHSINTLALTAICSVLLGACGGSSNSDEQPAPVATSSVTVIGDSLSDIGTFGIRHTVQSTSGVPYPLWTDLLTRATEAPEPCSYYLASSASSFNQRAGCTNYAVAGGRIQAPDAAQPTSILLQMQHARQAAGATGFGAQDLLLLDGGGNDAADLIEAYIALLLSAATQQTPDVASYAAFLQNVLGETATWALLQSSEHGAEAAAQAYMQALAERFAAAIQEQLLDAGAQRIAVLNIPDVTRTPRFQPLLQLLTLAAGPEAAAQAQQLLQGWLTAFNAQLDSAFASHPHVVVVDAFAQLGMWAEDASRFGFTNARDAVCPEASPATPLPSYDITQCTDSYLDAHAPAGAATGWWQAYAFADGFHPTPKGHAVMAQAVAEAMQAKGW